MSELTLIALESWPWGASFAGRYVLTDREEAVLPLEDAVVLLRKAEEEHAEADRRLNEVLKELGLETIGGSSK